MESATRFGRIHHRSAAEQIEYWALLGQRVSRILNPESLLDLAAGLVRLRLEPVVQSGVNPQQVFDALDADRVSGDLQSAVTRAPLRYQASAERPGFLEQISASGQRQVGQFVDGVFTPLSASDINA